MQVSADVSAYICRYIGRYICGCICRVQLIIIPHFEYPTINIRKYVHAHIWTPFGNVSHINVRLGLSFGKVSPFMSEWDSHSEVFHLFMSEWDSHSEMFHLFMSEWDSHSDMNFRMTDFPNGHSEMIFRMNVRI